MRYFDEQVALQSLADAPENDTPLVISVSSGTVDNTVSGVMIEAISGNNKISNKGALVTIVGGNGNDTVDNSGSPLVTIKTGAGNDSIKNIGSYVSIDAGNGNDKITNSGEHVSIDGGANDDTINNSGSDATINGGAGRDSIYNDGTKAIIDAGAGRNYIFNSSLGTNAVINSGDDSDRIYNYGKDVRIYGGGDKDTIENSGSNVNIFGGAGNDQITNKAAGNYTTINGGEGDDNIVNYATNVTINGGDDRDTIDNSGSNVKIFGDAGDDKITNNNGGDSVTVNAGDGDDTINNYGNFAVLNGGNGKNKITNNFNASNVSIMGGNDDDTIDNNGSNVTIDAGSGYNRITNRGKNVSIKGGADADTISNNVGGDSVTIDAGYGNNLITNSSKNVSIKSGTGNDRIINSGDSITIDAGDGDNYITNSRKNVSIKSGTGNDSIINNSSGNSVTIDAGGGDNYITNNSKNVSIKSGTGNDSITNSGSSVTIDAGDGADEIYNRLGSNVTLKGGAGNDYIYIRSHGRNTDSNVVNGGAGNDTIDIYLSNVKTVIEYGAGEGNDLIHVVGSPKLEGSNLNIKLTSGTLGSTLINSDGDIVLNVGDNTLTLREARSEIITVEDANGTKTVLNQNPRESVTIAGNSFSASADKSYYIYNANNNATITASNISDGVENLGDKVLIRAGSGNDAINNSGASVTVDGGAGNDYINNYGTNVSISGVEEISNYGDKTTINGVSGNDTISNYAKNVIINANDGDDEISNLIYEQTEQDESLTPDNVVINLGAGNDKVVNEGSNVTINANYGDNQIENRIKTLYNEQTLQDETLTPDNVVINLGAGNDAVVNEGSNVTINANTGNNQIENRNSNVLINGGDGGDLITNNTIATANDGSIFSENVTINSGAGDDQIDNYGNNVTIDAGIGDDYIRNEGSHVSINGGSGSNEIWNYGEGVTIDAGNGNDNISNNGSNVIINAGNGNDNISNDGSNVTINAGAGNDTINNMNSNVLFKYNDGDGNDYIEGFNETSTLRILSATGTYSTVNDDSNNVIVSVGTGRITLENAADFFSEGNIEGLALNVVGTDGDDKIDNTVEGATINALGGKDTINNYAVNVTINAGAGDDFIANHGGHQNGNILIDAGDGADTVKNHIHDVTIRGGAGNDSIYTGDRATIEGGAGNDTIISETYNGDDFTINGGADDDVISLGSNAGNGLIIYNNGDGNDSIGGFNGNDTLQIGDGTGTYFNKTVGNDVLVSVGSGVITIGGAANLSAVNIKGVYKNPFLIEGTSSSETLESNKANVTIKAGAGNDLISLGSNASNNVIVYNAGDGNDTISGFNGDDTLQIGDGNGTYFSDTVGNDVFVSVGSGVIKINGAASLGTVKITGVYKNPLLVEGTENADNLKNTIAGATILSYAGNDKVTNSGASVHADLGLGNDSMENSADYVTINAGAGNDSIKITKGNYHLINLGEGNNIVTVNNYSTIYGNTVIGGTGNDTVKDSAATHYNYVINLGAGKDSVGLNTLRNSTINTGDGDIASLGADNVAINQLFDSSILTDDGDDTVKFGQWNNTVSTGDGNDSVQITGGGTTSLNSVDLGAGDDKLNFSGGTKNTLLGGAGNDSIYHSTTSLNHIDLGDGNDTITFYGTNKNHTIYGGAGKDVINHTSSVSLVSNQIDLGGDDDKISLIGSDNTITGGTGNDNISLGSNASNNLIVYRAGDGNDVIRGFNSTTTLQIGDGNGTYSTAKSSYGDVIIQVGEGNVTLYSVTSLANVNIDGTYKNPLIIEGTDGNDSIQNNKANATINAGAGDDTIYNLGLNVSINGGAGNDSVLNIWNNVTINGGADDDFIDNDGSNVLIAGDDGADTINNYGTNVTINGGAGNDSIWNKGSSVTIDTGDGDNYIYNDGGKNVLVLANGGKNTVKGSDVTIRSGAGNSTITGDKNAQLYQYNGGNAVITNYSYEDTIELLSGKVDSYSFDSGDLIFNIGDGSLTLKDMAGHAITVKDSSGTTTQIYGKDYSAQDVIKNLVQAWNKTFLSGTAKLDESIKLSTHFNSIQDAINQMITDCRAAGDADTFLRKYCGINLDNGDTGAITGWDAGGLSAKTSDTVINETLSSLQHVPDYTDTTFTKRNLEINISSTGNSLTADGKKVFDAFYSWWAEESLKLIEESYGFKFSEGDKLDFSLIPSGSAWGQTWTSGKVCINMGSTHFASDDDYNGNGVDRTIAHELTHVTQFKFMGSLPEFLQEGLADLTCGSDDTKTSLIETFAGNADSLASYLDINKNGTGDLNCYVAGFMFLRYLAKQAVDNYDDAASYAWKDNSSIVGTSAAELLTGSGKNQTITAGDGNDTIIAYGDEMKIFGDAGNDSILTKGNAQTISAGEGNDTITAYGDETKIFGDAGNDSILAKGNAQTIDGGEGNDTLVGGAGADKFVYGVGNDVIDNYGDGDKISLASDVTITDFYKTNADLYIKFSVGSLKVKNASAVTFEQDGKEFVYSDGKLIGGDSVTLPATFDTEVTLGEGTKNLDATKRTAATKLNGNNSANSILGGKGADTLDGGLGDDTLTGGAGSDVFVYSGGKDIITDYTAGDKISATSDYQSYEISGEDIVINFADGGSLKLIDGADKTININGVAKNFAAGKTFNSNNTAVTLGANTTTYTADETVVTINASATNGATVIGNTKSNQFYGSDGADTFVYEHVQQEKTTYTLNGSGEVEEIVSTIYSAGSDVLYNFDLNDKISLGADVVLKDAYKQNDDVIIKVDSGTITVKDSANKSITLVQDSAETIFSGGIFHDAENQSVTLPATFVSEFNLGDYENVNASMRTAAMKLTGNAQNNSIVGGTGADTLDGAAGNDTLTGGKGNDVFIYSGGNDTITDYGTGSDKISIASGYTLQNSVVSGDDRILNFSDGGSIVLSGAKEKKIKFAKTSTAASVGTEDKFNSKNTAVTLGTATTTFNATNYPDLVTIKGSAVEGTLEVVGNDKSNRIYASKGGSTLNGGKGSDYLYSGNGADTFVYEHVEQEKTTYTADGAVVSTIYTSGSDIIYNYGEDDKISLGTDVVLKNAYKKNSDTIINVDSGTITVKDSTDKSITFVQDGEEITFNGDVFSKPDTSILPATFDAEVTLGEATKNLDASKRTAATKLTGNAQNNSIVGGTKNDTLDGGLGDDTLTGGVGSDTFIYSGGSDVIKDYGNGFDKISTSSNYSSYAISGKDIMFTFSDGTLKLEGAADSLITINGVAGKYSNDGMLNSKGTAITLKADAATYTAGADIVTIDGSQTANATLIGNAKSNRFYGGNGSTFVYNTGSNIIYNYASDNKISLSSESALKDFYTKNSDVIFRVDSGYITVKGAADKSITLEQGDKAFFYSNGELTDGKTVILPATFNSEYTLNSKANVDASRRTVAIKITGTNAANSIIGGAKNDTLYGGAGADTLWGNKGNDTLYGGDGNDTFIFKAGDGKDTILDFASGDILKILDIDGNASKFSKASYSSGKLTLTVAESGGTIYLKNLTTKTDININGTTYHVSGKTIK